MALNPFGEKVNKSTIIVEGTFQEDYEEFFPEYSKRVKRVRGSGLAFCPKRTKQGQAPKPLLYIFRF